MKKIIDPSLQPSMNLFMSMFIFCYRGVVLYWGQRCYRGPLQDDGSVQPTEQEVVPHSRDEHQAQTCRSVQHRRQGKNTGQSKIDKDSRL